MSPEMLALLLKSFWETCYMVLASTILATLIGVPLGVILTVTRKNHILPNAPVNSVLGAIVNATRSTPFIILMVAIIPLTRLLVGSSIGTTASIVPLTISAAPFIARIIESSLLEIDHAIFLIGRMDYNINNHIIQTISDQSSHANSLVIFNCNYCI